MFQLAVVLIGLTCSVVYTAYAITGSMHLSKVQPMVQERVVKLTPIDTDNGPAMIWVCDDENCPEGCDSRGEDAFGIGLLLQRSEELKGQWEN